MPLKELKGSTGSVRGRARMRRRRRARRIFIFLLILVLLLGGAGVAYAWYTARNAKVSVVEKPTPVTRTLKKATVPAKNVPVGVSVTILTSPIKPGSNASISIKTKPLAACSIRIEYNKQPSTDGGLVPKQADEYGVVTWTWTVEPTRPVGKWPIDVTCAEEEKSGYVRGELILE